MHRCCRTSPSRVCPREEAETRSPLWPKMGVSRFSHKIGVLFLRKKNQRRPLLVFPLLCSRLGREHRPAHLELIADDEMRRGAAARNRQSRREPANQLLQLKLSRRILSEFERPSVWGRAIWVEERWSRVSNLNCAATLCVAA